MLLILQAIVPLYLIVNIYFACTSLTYTHLLMPFSFLFSACIFSILSVCFFCMSTHVSVYCLFFANQIHFLTCRGCARTQFFFSGKDFFFTRFLLLFLIFFLLFSHFSFYSRFFSSARRFIPSLLDTFLSSALLLLTLLSSRFLRSRLCGMDTGRAQEETRVRENKQTIVCRVVFFWSFVKIISALLSYSIFRS